MSGERPELEEFIKLCGNEDSPWGMADLDAIEICEYALRLEAELKAARAALKVDDKALNRAIAHAVNYHGLDAKSDMPDWYIADLITEEVSRHLAGTTDVQVIERMTPEERDRIGLPPGDTNT